MSHVVDVDADGVRMPMPRRKVAEIVHGVLRAEEIDDAKLSIAFVDNRRIALLNRRHLGHRGATDVIAFAFASTAAGDPIIGDIYIATEVARRNATGNGVSFAEEVMRLVVHGVLHVVGYDHPEGEGRRESPMWQRQEYLVQALHRDARRRGTRRRRTGAIA